VSAQLVQHPNAEFPYVCCLPACLPAYPACLCVSSKDDAFSDPLRPGGTSLLHRLVYVGSSFKQSLVEVVEDQPPTGSGSSSSWGSLLFSSSRSRLDYAMSSMAKVGGRVRGRGMDGG